MTGEQAGCAVEWATRACSRNFATGGAETQLIDIMRCDADGKIAEHWGVMDMLTMMQQLGAIPNGPPAPPGKPAGH